MEEKYITLLEQFLHWVVSGGGWIWIGPMIVIAVWAFKRR